MPRMVPILYFYNGSFLPAMVINGVRALQCLHEGKCPVSVQSSHMQDGTECSSSVFHWMLGMLSC